MKDILDVLKGVGEIEVWTRRPHKDASGNELAYPPIISWRYRNASSGLQSLIHSAVATFQGDVPWRFLVTGRNWALMPARIEEYLQCHVLLGELEAAEELAVKEPEFGKHANQVLPDFSAHLENCVRDGTLPSEGSGVAEAG